MPKFIHTLLAPPERKLFVASATALCLLLTFFVTVYHPPAIEAMKVVDEWLVFLAASFMGGNALVAFANRGKPPPVEESPEPTKKPKPVVNDQNG